MKQYLLDTNICIFFLQGKYNVPTKLQKAGRQNCYISEITVAELLYGAACSAQPEKHSEQVKLFIAQFEILPIFSALPFYAQTKAHLRKNGQMIDDFDILIGATAVSANLVLVTENLKHLNRIPDITIENWIKR
ncbi:type II toxin-antitoxin system VapC family toxin [Bacteroides sp. 519]|uniref:type II toxin-antitoxin system VapC family toxin n=1 Tax=Bacteroides sp. 519 TaxID=2302937 RepID=UPI0013D43853|nr:type II toxin-antitoxin system VapC family toxin [Bacteroides sp. 519]NDV59397.1 type II toxin-antitoxin system VapC family toxin [Bacteroides sp. 519]